MGVAGTLSTISKKLINPANVDYAMDFLQKMWMYTSLQAKCFTIVVVGNDKLQFKHWCVDEHGDYPTMFSRLRKYLERALPEWSSRGEHVYYQVLPLVVKPEKGRGSSRDVKIGGWLWTDLDYKTAVDKPEFTGCKEDQDHALECYYSESGKWIHVKRPPLSQVIQLVKERLSIEPTIVVDSGAGYHLYFKLAYDVEASRLARLEAKLVDALGGDSQSKDLARILRLPGSINPRVNRLVRVIHYEPGDVVDPEELEQRLHAVPKTKPQATTELATTEHTQRKTRELRELSDLDIIRIAELLKEAYRPSYRQYILLYLSGWLAKAGISPISATKIAKALYECTGDSDSLKTRLATIAYSYKKAGVDITPYRHAISSLAGVEPYGLDKWVSEEEVKGKSGLQDVLEEIVGEDRALAIIQKLTEILGTASPFKDSLISIVEFEKQICAVADFRRKIVVRARLKDGKLVFKEKILHCTPIKVTVYINPLDNSLKYHVTFESATLPKPISVGPAFIDDIIAYLRGFGLIANTRLAYEILTAILQAFMKWRLAEVKEELDAPGFYLLNNRIVSVRINVQEVNKEMLREQLRLLDELVENWFAKVKERFVTILKWSAIAPFNYILKQKGKRLKWLYLCGDSGTGKTTMGIIGLRLWRTDENVEIPGGAIDSIAKLGKVVSQTTLPLLINEVADALSRSDVIEGLKNAVDSLFVRGRHNRGLWENIPALASCILTSNTFLPTDDALTNRFIIMKFTYAELPHQQRLEEFNAKFGSRALKINLGEIGNCIANLVISNPSVLDASPDALEIGAILLGRCYEMAGLERPQWLNLRYEEPGREEIISWKVEEFVEELRKYVNDLYTKHIMKTEVIKVVGDDDGTEERTVVRGNVDMETKLLVLLEHNLIPGMRYKNGKVYILMSLLRELDIDTNLKSLAELLGPGFTWGTYRLDSRTTVKAIETNLRRLTELLEGLTEDELSQSHE